jgi:hypothetical protein
LRKTATEEHCILRIKEPGEHCIWRKRETGEHCVFGKGRLRKIINCLNRSLGNTAYREVARKKVHIEEKRNRRTLRIEDEGDWEQLRIEENGNWGTLHIEER